MAKRNSARKHAPGTEAEIVLPDVTPEPGDIIDGTEDDTTEMEREETAPVASNVGSGDVSPAVKAAVKAAKNAAAKTQKKVKVEPMAEVTSKAEMIRNEIGARKAAGSASIRPRDIVAALASRGVKVHAPQVSVAIRDYGKGDATPKSSEKKGKRVLARVATPEPSKTKKTETNGAALSVGELERIRAFVTTFNGADSAHKAIDAFTKYCAALTN